MTGGRKNTADRRYSVLTVKICQYWHCIKCLEKVLNISPFIFCRPILDILCDTWYIYIYFIFLQQVHKPLAFRSIVSHPPSCKLARFLSCTTLATSNAHTIKFSFDFINKLKPVPYTLVERWSVFMSNIFLIIFLFRCYDCLSHRLQKFHRPSVDVQESWGLVSV